MRTLRSAGPTKLDDREQDQIREAADALLFCDDLDTAPAAREALAEISELAGELVDTGRWLPGAAERLVEDIAACGPIVLLV
jgi:hypothetical protein